MHSLVRVFVSSPACFFIYRTSDEAFAHVATYVLEQIRMHKQQFSYMEHRRSGPEVIKKFHAQLS